MGFERFQGPYRASSLNEFALCSYRYYLNNVARVKRDHIHAKSILGTTLHWMLQAWHLGTLTKPWNRLEDPTICFDYTKFLFAKIVEDGDPRWPRDKDLPVLWGHKNITLADGTKKKQEFTREEFESLWLPKTATMISQYCSQPYNQNIHLISAEEKLDFIVTKGKNLKAKKGAYRVTGHPDLIREHRTLRTLSAQLHRQPGAIDELEARLAARGKLIEIIDFKTTKTAPIHNTWEDPFAVLRDDYQLRAYAYGFEQDSQEPVDLVTYFWLPGYLPRQKGQRTPSWSNKRVTKTSGPVQYLPGKAPGDPGEPDPRYSFVITQGTQERFVNSVVGMLGQQRMGFYSIQPGDHCRGCSVFDTCHKEV